MKEIIVTKHAEKRAKERCGYNKKSTKRIAQKVYEEGIRTNEVKGEVRSWLQNRQELHAENEEIRLYGDKAWMFTNAECPVLLTILQIPQCLQRKVNGICRA